MARNVLRVLFFSDFCFLFKIKFFELILILFFYWLQIDDIFVFEVSQNVAKWFFDRIWWLNSVNINKERFRWKWQFFFSFNGNVNRNANNLSWRKIHSLYFRYSNGYTCSEFWTGKIFLTFELKKMILLLLLIDFFQQKQKKRAKFVLTHNYAHNNNKLSHAHFFFWLIAFHYKIYHSIFISIIMEWPNGFQ